MAASGFTVVCDETNNSPEVVGEHGFVVDVTIEPEFTIHFTVCIDEDRTKGLVETMFKFSPDRDINNTLKEIFTMVEDMVLFEINDATLRERVKTYLELSISSELGLEKK